MEKEFAERILEIRCIEPDGLLVLTSEGIRSGSVRCRLKINWPKGCLFQGTAWIESEFLKSFAEELEILHSTLQGEAILENGDSDLGILFVADDSDPGRIEVMGWMSCRNHLVKHVRSQRSREWKPFAGTAVQFGGLWLDQSYLPQLVRKVVMFMEEADISGDQS